MPITPALPTFTADTNARAEDVTTAFAAVRDTLNTYGVLTDVARTVTVTNTYTLTQTFTGGWTAGAACTISTGGLTVTGNSTITGTLGGVTTLTADTGAFTTLSGTPNFTGVPTFASGLGTQTAMTITTLTNTTINTQIVQLDAGAASLSLKGTVAGGSKVWASWTESGAAAVFGGGATTMSLGGNATEVLVGGGTTMADSSTTGFFHVRSINGTPSGTPSAAAAGYVPMVVHPAGLKLWFYFSSDWHYVDLTATP